jgi:hypothetical protein
MRSRGGRQTIEQTTIEQAFFLGVAYTIAPTALLFVIFTAPAWGPWYAVRWWRRHPAKV